jgi:hypothetical protein
MPQPSHTDRPTHVIVIASKILRTLHPSPLGTLIAVYNGDGLTQKEISDIVGRSQPAVSTYFQSFESLPAPLTVKQGQRNTVTNTGEKIIALVRGMSTELNFDFASIDWSDETDRTAVSSLLSPLHDSRSTEPFFLLDSLYDRSDLDSSLGIPQPVWIDDVIHDVEVRHHESGGSTTLKQIRQTVKRFTDAGALTFEEDQLTLEEKGQEQAKLLTKLVQFLIKQDDIDIDQTDTTDRQDSTESNAESLGGVDAVRSDVADSLRQSPALDGIANQQHGHGFSGARRSSDVDRLSVQEQPTVVLTYCLQSPDESGTDKKSPSHPLPVLLLTSLTASELASRAEQVVQGYGEDTRLVPYWALQTETDLYPLGPAGIPPAAISDVEDDL